LGKTGINLSYQAGAQNINAEDRQDLLEPGAKKSRLIKPFKAPLPLVVAFLLWQGKGLPATATEGLRYTPAPVVPTCSCSPSYRN